MDKNTRQCCSGRQAPRDRRQSKTTRHIHAKYSTPLRPAGCKMQPDFKHESTYSSAPAGALPFLVRRNKMTERDREGDNDERERAKCKPMGPAHPAHERGLESWRGRPGAWRPPSRKQGAQGTHHCATAGGLVERTSAFGGPPFTSMFDV